MNSFVRSVAASANHHFSPHSTAPSRADDLPGLVQAYVLRESAWDKWAARDGAVEWGEKWWFADAATLRTNEFNLSASRYRPMSQAQVAHRDPLELLDELAAIESEIAVEVDALRAALTETGE